MRRIRRWALAASLAAAGLLGCAPGFGPASMAAPRTIDTPPPVAGLTVRAVTHVDARMTDYTLVTSNLPAPTIVRVILPVDYAAHAAARFPVEYVLGGCCTPGARQAAWSDPSGGNAEALTAPYGVITVLPDGGLGSMYTDWAQPGRSGQVLWESYFVHQLMPWVDRGFRTVPARSGRAILGVSMGGYGAAAIAARHPDLFAAMASFSGIPDTNIRPWLYPELAAADGGLPNSLWGPRDTEEVVWRGHNPTDLAINLSATKIFLASGNGKDGPLPDPNHGTLIEYLDHWDEMNAHQETVAFAAALKAAGLAFTFDDYGNGEHVWPYWRADLKRTLPVLMKLFAKPVKAPASFSLTAIEPTFSAWGYTVKMTRSVAEFATLSTVTFAGFRLSGSGTGYVTTAARYVPGRSYSVTASTSAGRVTWRVTADPGGRLSIPVVLGASNSVQQYLPDSASRRKLETAAVTIAGS